jgi:hypothetical protein
MASRAKLVEAPTAYPDVALQEMEMPKTTLAGHPLCSRAGLVYEHGVWVKGVSPIAGTPELKLPGDEAMKRAMLVEEKLCRRADLQALERGAC